MSDIFFFLTILKILILNIGKFIPLTINTYSFSNEVKKSCFLVHTGTTGFFCNFPHEFILIPNNHNKNLPKKILDVTNTDKNYLHYLNRHKPLFSIFFSFRVHCGFGSCVRPARAFVFGSRVVRADVRARLYALTGCELSMFSPIDNPMVLGCKGSFVVFTTRSKKVLCLICDGSCIYGASLPALSDILNK